MPTETNVLISRPGNRMEIIAHYSTTVLFVPQQEQSFAGRKAERVLLPGLVLWSWGKVLRMTNSSVVLKQDADQTGLGGFSPGISRQ